MRLFLPITKVDEATRTVYATATQEVPDREDEIFDYDSSKPYVEAWSDYFDKQTTGKSKGNLRAMHRNVSAGKVTEINFDDVAKRVDVAIEIVDDEEWNKFEKGLYTGLSMSGRVVRRWRDPDNRKYMRYTAKPNEISLADYPAVPTAVFKFAKSDGTVEDRHFARVAERTDTTPKAGESKYGDVEFADAKNKKYPLDTKARVRNALSRWGDEKNRAKYSAKDQATIGRKIRAAARKMGIDVTEKAMLRGDFSKGLYAVSGLAGLVESLSWCQREAEYEREREGDESEVPDKLLDALASLTEVLEEMTGEECAELLADLGHEDDDEFATTKTAASHRSSTTMANAQEPAGTFRKISKAHMAKLADVAEGFHAVHKLFGDHVDELEGTKHHDTAKAIHKMLGGNCEKLDGFHGEVSGQSTTEPDADEEHGEKIAKVVSAVLKEMGVSKAAGTAAAGSTAAAAATTGTVDKATADDIAALKAENAEFRKTVEALAGGTSALLQAFGARPGALKTVDKADDLNAGNTDVAKTAGGDGKTAEEPKTIHDAWQRSFANPIEIRPRKTMNLES